MADSGMHGDCPRGRVAVLGTGIMGAPMARHLREQGHAVAAWDRDPERLVALASDGVQSCRTAQEAVASADVVVTMLTDAEVTREVADDAFGSFDGLWIQSATVGLDGTRALLELAGERGITMVDCPILGTRSSAEAGALTALASGPAEVEPLCRSTIDAYCRSVLWLGEAGRGSRLKLVMNNWVLGLTTLTAETIALAEGLGLPGQRFLDIVRDGPLDVEQAHIKGAMMQQADYPAALPLRLAAKDARLIAAAAEEAGLDLPLGRAVAALMTRAEGTGDGDEDFAAVYRAVATTRASE
jgi:3-hydroxyisobutyrate dehydrogenase